jgi:hypothetical protein
VIRRWLGLCEEFDPYYGVVRCKLRHHQDGDHHFGWIHTPYLHLDLDAPIHLVSSLPTEPATPLAPPKGTGGVAVDCGCCCRCNCCPGTGWPTSEGDARS